MSIVIDPNRNTNSNTNTHKLSQPAGLSLNKDSLKKQESVKNKYFGNQFKTIPK